MGSAASCASSCPTPSPCRSTSPSTAATARNPWEKSTTSGMATTATRSRSPSRTSRKRSSSTSIPPARRATGSRARKPCSGTGRRYGGGKGNEGKGSPAAAQDGPSLVDRPIVVHAEIESRDPRGVVLAQGGRQRGYALHFVDGRPAFDLRVEGEVTRVIAPRPCAAWCGWRRAWRPRRSPSPSTARKWRAPRPRVSSRGSRWTASPSAATRNRRRATTTRPTPSPASSAARGSRPGAKRPPWPSPCRRRRSRRAWSRTSAPSSSTMPGSAIPTSSAGPTTATT